MLKTGQTMEPPKNWVRYSDDEVKKVKENLAEL